MGQTSLVSCRSVSCAPSDRKFTEGNSHAHQNQSRVATMSRSNNKYTDINYILVWHTLHSERRGNVKCLLSAPAILLSSYTTLSSDSESDNDIVITLWIKVIISYMVKTDITFPISPW